MYITGNNHTPFSASEPGAKGRPEPSKPSFGKFISVKNLPALLSFAHKTYNVTDNVTANIPARLTRCASLPDIQPPLFKVCNPRSNKALWLTDQVTFNQIRTGLLKIENERTKEFVIYPGGSNIIQTYGNHADKAGFTQPTVRGCSVTSLLNMISDLLINAKVIDSEASVKDRFCFIVDHFLSKEEGVKLFREGLNLEELTTLSNKILETSLPDWKATAYPTPEISFDQFCEGLSDKQNRCIVNMCSPEVYNLEGQSGHWVFISDLIEEKGVLYAKILDSADYKYPAQAYIPLDVIYKATCKPGTDGTPRGFIILSKQDSQV